MRCPSGELVSALPAWSRGRALDAEDLKGLGKARVDCGVLRVITTWCRSERRQTRGSSPRRSHRTPDRSTQRCPEVALREVLPAVVVNLDRGRVERRSIRKLDAGRRVKVYVAIGTDCRQRGRPRTGTTLLRSPASGRPGLDTWAATYSELPVAHERRIRVPCRHRGRPRCCRR